MVAVVTVVVALGNRAMITLSSVFVIGSVTAVAVTGGAAVVSLATVGAIAVGSALSGLMGAAGEAPFDGFRAGLGKAATNAWLEAVAGKVGNNAATLSDGGDVAASGIAGRRFSFVVSGDISRSTGSLRKAIGEADALISATRCPAFVFSLVFSMKAT